MFAAAGVPRVYKTHQFFKSFCAWAGAAIAATSKADTAARGRTRQFMMPSIAKAEG
jgi:hypothetical protein